MYELSLQRSFSVPVALLFKAWSQPEMLRRWFCPDDMNVPEVDVDFRVGGQYRIVMQEPNQLQHIVYGEYLDIVPNESIKLSWNWVGRPVRTEVELSFRAVDGGSELVLAHRQFPDEDARDKHNHGWTSCLEKLRHLLA